MSSISEDAAKLIAVVQVFRHGQRTPLIKYPKDPYGEETYWPYGYAALTNVGKQQMYELGKFTRERYKYFLPRQEPVKHFKIYTTEKERCITSALAYNAGLYPPIKEEIWNENLLWTPIPTYMAEPYLFRGETSLVSPAYNRESKKIVMRSLEEFKKDPLSEMVFYNAGIPKDNYNYLVATYDALWVQDSLGLKLPDWAKEFYPAYKNKFIYEFLEITTETPFMKRLFVGPLLYEVVNHFEKMAQDSSSGPRLMAFSGHDVNVIGLLEVFGAYERHVPPHASSLFIELKMKNGEHFVNIFYKRNDIVPIKICGGGFDCNLKKFKTLLSPYLISKQQFLEESV